MGKVNKPRMGLLGTVALSLIEVVRVLEFGLSKYPDADNWRSVPLEEHKHALGRHVFAYFAGVKLDHESRCHHMAHAACRALFIVWLDN